MERLDVTIVLESEAEGQIQRVRGVLGQTIRDTLGVKKWGAKPYSVSYVGVAENPDRYAYYSIALADDDELGVLWDAIEEAFEADGWEYPPVGTYTGAMNV